MTSNSNKQVKLLSIEQYDTNLYEPFKYIDAMEVQTINIFRQFMAGLGSFIGGPTKISGITKAIEKVNSISSYEVPSHLKNNSNTYENMNSQLNPFKNDSKLDLENTFDSHISSNSKMENKKLFDKEVIRSGSNKSAGEVIEKTLKHKVSLRDYIINQINLIG